MIEEAKSIKLEIHYGEEYVKKALLASLVLGDQRKEEVKKAMDCMSKSRMALDRYKLYLTGGKEYPYGNETNDANNIVELDADYVNIDDVEVNTDFSDVKHIKFTMRGMNMIIDKVIALRMKRMTISNPMDQVMSVNSLVKAIDSLEEAYMRLGNVMRSIARDNPSEYSSVQTVESVNEDKASDEVKKTDDLMEGRAQEVGEQPVAEEKAGDQISTEESSESDSEGGNFRY